MGYCKTCSTKLKDYRSKFCKSCSKKGKFNPMYNMLGLKHPRFKGGYIHKTLGYRFIMKEGKKVYEHRSITEEKLGRKLLPTEIVHHINGIKTDNRHENLAVMSQSEHVVLHKPRLTK